MLTWPTTPVSKASSWAHDALSTPGAKLCTALKRAKVNIDAVSVSENAECCSVRMIAAPAAWARKALT